LIQGNETEKKNKEQTEEGYKDNRQQSVNKMVNNEKTGLKTPAFGIRNSGEIEEERKMAVGQGFEPRDGY